MLIILTEDVSGRRNSLTFGTGEFSGVATLVTQCEQRLPTDANNPAKAEILQEISALEDRVTKLKEAIGQA